MALYRPKLGVGTKTLIALSLVFWLPVAALTGMLYHLFQGWMQDESIGRIETQLQGALSVYRERSTLLQGTLGQLAARPDVQQAMALADKIPLPRSCWPPTITSA